MKHQVVRCLLGSLTICIAGALAWVALCGQPASVLDAAGSGAGFKAAEKKKIVFIAGRKSHGYGGHEHNAGCLFLAKCLKENMPNLVVEVCKNGWPQDAKVLEDADAIVAFSDGQGSHVLMRHLEEVDRLMKKGVGLALLHYAVEPVGHKERSQGGAYFLEWAGGYFERRWSVNPHWLAEFKKFPKHPVTRGVKPFAIEDEWYYNMRFPEGMKNVTPVLTAVPPDKTRMRPDGDHSGNPYVRARKGMPEHLAWAFERPGGGRGFGFTGGHWHWNWSNDSFRTIVLNGIVWTAGLDIPEGGVPSATPTLEELKADQDYPEPKNYNWERWRKLLAEWKAGG